ncbi:MAG: DUF120 domain-containing protein [Anaerolineae bacterium]
MGTVALRGRVITGHREGAAFTQLPWVRTQFGERLGIDPFPGTLNLWLDEPAELEKWSRLKENSGVRIEPVSPDFCEAKGFPAMVVKPGSPLNSQDYSQPAAIILPDVSGYPNAQVELIASVSLRDTLGLRDGDILSVHVEVGGGRG